MGIKEYVAKKKEQFAKFKAEQAAKAEKAAGERRAKEAKELQRLRKQRIEEEGDAKLRTARQREMARIEKAKAAGKPKQQQGSGSGGNILDLSAFAGSGGSDLGMGAMFAPAGSKAQKQGNSFDFGNSGGILPEFGSLGTQRKPKHRVKKHKRGR